jgi:hypothetical protein
MSRRLVSLALACCSLVAVGATVGSCPDNGSLLSDYHIIDGYTELHTPGAGPGSSAPVQALLGPTPNLNRISYIRTHIERAGAPPPKTILILVPGFLGGASFFLPLAEQLVRQFNGNLEVWSIDRRPNQLEDRRGTQYVIDQGVTQQSLLNGFQLYFPDVDAAPTGNFPGTEDSDVDADGVLDPPFTLPDAFGVQRPYIRFAQDDVRFMAHWGIDTSVRDWKILVENAREIVGEDGLVLFGGHSLGTSWTGIFAAYDFDPGPGVDPAYQYVDGLLLLEGGGPANTNGNVRDTLAQYQAKIAALETPGGPEVYQQNLSFGPTVTLPGPNLLGPIGALSGIAGVFRGSEPSVARRTNLFGTGLFALFFTAPTDNRSTVGLFIDDDFQILDAFKASVGYTDDGPNQFILGILIAQPNGSLRRWKEYDDPTLPSIFSVPPCDPAGATPANPTGVGCAILDNGPPRGVEREVTDLDDILRTQFSPDNAEEWYYMGGRVNVDLQYGRDSTALGDESLIAITQNANVNVPVLGIGGSNGLAFQPSSFSSYLGSIATPPEWKQVAILPGYAHVDLIAAAHNEAVPIITDWVARVQQRKLLGSF